MRSQSGIIILLLASVCFLVSPALSYPDAAVLAYNHGVSLTAAGNYSEAVQSFDQAVTLDPLYFEAWNDKADALNRNKNFAEALLASDRALALNPEYVRGWINRGYILYNLGRYDEELLAYEQAVSIDPDSADAWFNKGYALGGMGKWDEALRAFDKVESLNPAYPNLAANQRIAQNNLDATTPFYIKNALLIGGIVLVIVFAAAWVYLVRKKY